jgi:hypothetical protein
LANEPNVGLANQTHSLLKRSVALC